MKPLETQHLDLPMKELEALCRRYQVRELSLFGSALRGASAAASDVDLLVEFEPQAAVGFLALARVQRELAALLGRQVMLQGTFVRAQ